MSYAAERNAVMSRFNMLWNGRTKIAVPNLKFDQPAGEAWVMVSIANGEATQRSIGNPGNNVHRHLGVIFVQCFVPLGTDTLVARQLADDAAAIFRNARFDGIRCYAASVAEVGPDENWFQVNMSCPFQRDELL